MYVKQAGDLFRLLGDEARLRLLRVLAGKHGRLNVTELTAVLGIAQSGVSRHLRLLKEAGLVVEERGGGFSFYRLSPALIDGGFGGLWTALQAQFAGGRRHRRPCAAMTHGCRKSSGCARRTSRCTAPTGRSSCPAAAGRPGRGRLACCCRRSTSPISRAAKDTCRSSRRQWARRVVGIDRSTDVLKRAKALAERRGVKNITWKRGDMEKLPLENARASTWRCSRRRCTMRPNPARAVVGSRARAPARRAGARARSARTRSRMGPRSRRRSLARIQGRAARAVSDGRRP